MHCFFPLFSHPLLWSLLLYPLFLYPSTSPSSSSQNFTHTTSLSSCPRSSPQPASFNPSTKPFLQFFLLYPPMSAPSFVLTLLHLPLLLLSQFFFSPLFFFPFSLLRVSLCVSSIILYYLSIRQKIALSRYYNICPTDWLISPPISATVRQSPNPNPELRIPMPIHTHTYTRRQRHRHGWQIPKTQQAEIKHFSRDCKWQG